MKWLSIIAATALLAGALGARAQSVEAVAAAEKVYKAALRQTPLTLPVALFVKAKATGFGMYEARETNHFKIGEPLKFYLEPLGYKYKRNGDLVDFGVSMDLRLMRGDETLYGKDDFLDVNFESHHDNAELMLNGSLDLSGAPAGDYRLELTLRDHSSADVARAVLPFTID
jgi:hypothetical protein